MTEKEIYARLCKLELKVRTLIGEIRQLQEDLTFDPLTDTIE